MKARGIVIGFLLLWVLLLLAACTGGGGGGLCVGGVVSKDDAGSIFVFVGVLEGSPSGPGVEDAEVTINGTPVPGTGQGKYELPVCPDIDEESPVRLEVARGATVISATLDMPEKPEITAPEEDEIVSGPVNLLWSSETDPDSFEIIVLGSYTISGASYNAELPGDARGLRISGIFKTSSDSSLLTVVALNATNSFTGDAAPDSTFGVGNSSNRYFDPEP